MQNKVLSLNLALKYVRSS